MKWLAKAVVLALSVTACEDKATPLDLGGPPTQITIVSGEGQRGAVGEFLPVPLVIRVTDDEGNPAAALQVSWLVKSGALSVVNDSTDNAGESAAFWQLPSTPGVDSVAAVVEGLGTVFFGAIVQPIPGDIVFRYLDAGSYHACGITTTEQLLCWGYNGDGQLGTGAVSPPQLFPIVSAAGDLRYRLVSGGQFHACATTLAQVAYCWGNDQDGRLGDGGGPGKTSPTPVPVQTNLTFQSVQAGRLHTCGIELGQAVLCWGQNNYGQLGHSGNSPDSVSAGESWKSVAVGGQHTCAITIAGAAFCWGYNALGQLGDGSATTNGVPQAVAGGFTFQRDPIVIFPSPDPDFPLPAGPFMAAGHDHTCAITTGVATLCWGLNQDGQLGDGTRTTRTAPTPAAGPALVALTAGVRHTCGLTAAGAAFCWGDNTFGQLGDGTKSDKLSPVAVSGGLVFAYIKAGDLFTCGITSAGAAYCWGDNEYGQLGDGSTTASSVPVKVAFQP